MVLGAHPFFEGCLPVEILARRGRRALAFGPMRPVGLSDPCTGRRPHALLQLRQDNLAGSLYNLVGFQTNLTIPEQRRVFRMIPGLENAEFARYGQMHRNTFIFSPAHLNPTLQFGGREDLFFAGQITGVEGYAGNIATGLLAGCATLEPPVPETPEEAASALESARSASLLLNAAFVALMPLKLTARKYAGVADIAEGRAALENFLRMERWIQDSPDEAGGAFLEFVRVFFQENRLVRGGLEIGDRVVDPRRIECPVLNVYASQDHLVPPSASKALAGLTGSRDYTPFEFDGGHIGIYVSRSAQELLPCAIAEWLAPR